jgi:hypothetical protein
VDEKKVGLKSVSVTPLGLFPSVLAKGGEEGRMVVNCYKEKKVGLKSLFVTPLNLFPSVLAKGGEEGRTVVNCSELDCSGSLVASCVTAEKMTDTKGSSGFFWVKLFLGISCVLLDRVKGILGRVVGVGYKPNGFRSKHVSKKPIIPLKPFWKSLGQSVKLCFKSSILHKVSGYRPSIPVGSHGGSVVLSSPDILKDCFGAVAVERGEPAGEAGVLPDPCGGGALHGSKVYLTAVGTRSDPALERFLAIKKKKKAVEGWLLGLLEIRSETFSQDHRLDNVVLDSTARDGLVPMSSDPSPSESQFEPLSASKSPFIVEVDR